MASGPHGNEQIILQVLRPRQADLAATAQSDKDVASVLAGHAAMKKIGSTDEARNEARRRTAVYLLRCSNLLKLATSHDHDAVGHCQRLFLVMGHQDGGNPQAFLDLDEVRPACFPASFGRERPEARRAEAV